MVLALVEAMSRLLAVVCLASCLVSASIATAQPGMTEPSPPPPPSQPVAGQALPGQPLPGQPVAGPDRDVPVPLSYKKSIIVADSIAGGMMIGGAVLLLPCVFGDGADDDGICAVSAIGLLGGLGTWVVASPIIHLANDNPSGAGLSLLLRLGLPAVGFALAESTDDAVGGYAVLGAVSAAMLIDWFALAKHDAPPAPPPRYMPTVTPTLGGATLGLSGAF